MGRAPQQHYEMRTTDTEWQELARTMQGNGNPPHQEYPIVTERQNWNRQKKRKKIIPQCRIDAKVFSITWWKHNVCWCICTWILYKSQTGLNLRGWFVGERGKDEMNAQKNRYLRSYVHNFAEQTGWLWGSVCIIKQHKTRCCWSVCVQSSNLCQNLIHQLL